MSITIKAIGLLTERIKNQKQLAEFISQDSLSITENFVQAEIATYKNKRYFKKLDVFSQMTLIAVEQILPVANLKDQLDTGIFIGNNFAGWNYVEPQLKAFYKSGDFNAIDPFVATAWFPTAAQGEVSITNKLFGYSKTFALDELSGGIALYHAYNSLKDNKLKTAIAGGVESVHFQLVHDYINSVCQSIHQEYVPVDAACFIRLEQEDVIKEQDTVEITAMAMRASFEEALSACLQANTHNIDYCIMPVLSGHYSRESLALDLSTLKNTTKKEIAFGAPQQKAGNTVSASFPFAVACANALLRKDKMRQILVVGKSYGGMYLCVLLRN